ncbi:MAG: glycosyltransferase [Prevotellaceae bacterium]|jgi:glycosyltransferase involved in cell wall biosynthesis|nr:glycosyltransferase [Prevotellaceae bacterium]
MNENPKLSIILPCYNVEKYISRCLDSIYKQNIPETEYEVICVNDCSPDNSREIVLYFQKRHENLILLEHEVNKKLGAARNTGLKAAKGKYIWFIDSDDYIVENCFEKLLNLCEKDNLDLLMFSFYKQIDTLNFVQCENISTNDIIAGKEFLELFFEPQKILSSCVKIFNRTFLLENNLFFAENVFWEDADCIYKSIFYAKKIRSIQDAYYYYCLNQESISRTLNSRKIADMVKMGTRKLNFANEILEISPSLSQKIKNDALWNTTAVRKIVKLSTKEIDNFYALLSDNQFIEIKKLTKLKYRWMFFCPSIVKICNFISNYAKKNSNF